MRNHNTKEIKGAVSMLGWIEIFLRSASLFFLSLIVVRILGKRHPLKMTPFAFISYLVIGIISALISLNIIESFVFGIIALLTWAGLFIILDYASMKSKTFHDLVFGRESILIKDGKVLEENLSKERLTAEELLSALRTKNAFSLADVEFAIMESTGDINVFLKSDKKPVTPHDLEKKVAPQSVPQTVILDGNIMLEPLSNLGLNKEWLQVELEKLGANLNNVFIGQVDSTGTLYVDLFDDMIKAPDSQVKELLYANIEKCYADFLSYSLETNNESAKNMYSQNADKLKNMLNKLRPYLLR